MVDLAARLTGEQVVLYPYLRGVYGRDALYKLWQMVEYDGTAASIFYAQVCPDESWRGDLVEFVHYFSSEAPRRQLLVVTRKGDGTPIGLVWFDAVPGQRYALIGLWYQRHTTPLAREGTTLATRYAFEVLGYHKVCGWTPHKTALRHGLALGWRHEATLPGFIQVGGEARDIYVMVKERDSEELPQDRRGHRHTAAAPSTPVSAWPVESEHLKDNACWHTTCARG